VGWQNKTVAFVKVLSLSQLPPGTAAEIMLGGSPIALCHAAGAVHALWGICPHHGGPLGHGAVNGESIACPWHGWEFNCATGRNDFDPDSRVQTFPVKIEGDDILVDLDA
jgi:nitrite reductase/ring-hydroxylating ferredoxin subunit